MLSLFIPDNSELTFFFLNTDATIRNKNYPLYINQICLHTGLLGPLAQGNEINQLLVGSLLEASEFHDKHHANCWSLKGGFSVTWRQANKEIIKKVVVCVPYIIKPHYTLELTQTYPKKLNLANGYISFFQNLEN